MGHEVKHGCLHASKTEMSLNQPYPTPMSTLLRNHTMMDNPIRPVSVLQTGPSCIHADTPGIDK